MLAVPSRRSVDPIEDRGDLQELGPGIQKVVVQHLHRIARIEHAYPNLLTIFGPLHHGKTAQQMQTPRPRPHYHLRPSRPIHAPCPARIDLTSNLRTVESLGSRPTICYRECPGPALPIPPQK